MAIHKGTPTKDGRIWYFTKYKNGINHTSKKYLTKEECQKAESKFILKNENPINKRFDIVSEEYFNYIKQFRKESTLETYIQAYNKHIYPYFKSFYINQVNHQDIRNWAETMQKQGLNVRYLNKIYSIIKCIFNYAISNYGLNYNPVLARGNFKEKKEIVKDEEKLRYITKEEFDKFISVIDIPLWHCFFTTLYYTGARKGELLALTWNDINFNTKEISINKTLNAKLKGRIDITATKNYLNRKIKMSKTLYEELYSYYQDQKQYKDFNNNWYIFNGPVYLPLTTIDRYKHKYFELSGVREITIHEFRHSHVSLLINEYIKSGQTDTTKFFLMMSNRMGHTIGVMQRTYMHLFPTVQDEIIDLLDNL
jgi:integrase